MARQEPVPTFYLYGEPHRVVADDFLHVESLDDRSRPAGWRIRPHAHRELNHLILIAEGGGVMRAEAGTTAFEAPCLLLVPARVVHGFRWHDESRGAVVTLANSHLDALVRRDPDVAALFSAPGVVMLAPEAAQAIAAYAAAMMRELGWAAPGHRAALDAGLMSIIVHALRSRAAPSAVGAGLPGRQAALVARLRARIEERFRLREPIAAYAESLGVSVTTLRVACAKVGGVPPGEMLDRRALLEAKRALCYTNWSVAEIAYSLGFADPAYFTRLFTRRTGTPPRRFRRERSGAGTST